MAVFRLNYTYDEIGNRKSATTAYPNVPITPTILTYSTNPLNQYTAITQAAIYQATSSQAAFSLNPTVDLNGSTLNDGRTVSTWDERNQRRSVTQTANGEQLICKFDAVGRRTEEQELSATNSEIRKTRYLYDGWNCVAEFVVTPVTGTLVRAKTHTWGLDLSQTPQGAGGVGGLLATVVEGFVKDIQTFAYDGNGNVAALYSNSFGVAASYEYDPFGNMISGSGFYWKGNKYRFSTKPQDRIGGLYYYGYRYYDPQTGRWPSRDPIEEEGGVNLYGLLGNDTVNKLDYLGNDWLPPVPPENRGPGQFQPVPIPIMPMPRLPNTGGATRDEGASASGNFPSAVIGGTQMLTDLVAANLLQRSQNEGSDQCAAKSRAVYGGGYKCPLCCQITIGFYQGVVPHLAFTTLFQGSCMASRQTRDYQNGLPSIHDVGTTYFPYAEDQYNPF